MQEVFSKIIEELEENQTIVFNLGGGKPKQSIDLERAIEIVKQEAEKFGTDTNVGSNGWIPVSERLPNQDGEFTDVLITCESIADGVFVQSAEFYIAAEGEPVFDALYHYERVLAWMPLPHPYQTEGEHVKKTNFDRCCESMEAMAQIIDIAKIGWTKEQIMEWLQKEECEVPE